MFNLFTNPQGFGNLEGFDGNKNRTIMAELRIPLEPDRFYHIYNRGINGCPVFQETTNYEHFLSLYDKHISPVADTYAWVLMGNHFHLLVRIKNPEDILKGNLKLEDNLKGNLKLEDNLKGNLKLEDNLKGNLKLEDNLKGNLNPQGFENLEGFGTMSVEKRINQQFSNLFNAYTKAYNKKYNRTGSLFEHTFRRKPIDNGEYLKKTVLYIHNNPIHHGFCSHPLDYPWSSYLTCISVKPTRLHREAVIGWFDSQANFKSRHNGKIEVEEIEGWLGI
jgi:putative transposase